VAAVSGADEGADATAGRANLLAAGGREGAIQTDAEAALVSTKLSAARELTFRVGVGIGIGIDPFPAQPTAFS
jgi:hypothetical protein